MAKINAILPYYGANRLLAEQAGKLLAGSRWVGVPFGGGLSELQFIRAPSIIVADLHEMAIMLAQVIGDPDLCPELVRLLSELIYHPAIFEAAQNWMRKPDSHARRTHFLKTVGWSPETNSRVAQCAAYFITQWMGRSGMAGTKKEFTGSLPVRWTCSGGDSNTRYRSAVESLREWRQYLYGVCFVVMDCFHFLGCVKDRKEHAIYADPPWPNDGDCYKHAFTEEQHGQLEAKLRSFEKVKVVVRYGDHPLIRKLYGRPPWRFVELEGRTQANKAKRELLICNRKEHK